MASLTFECSSIEGWILEVFTRAEVALRAIKLIDCLGDRVEDAVLSWWAIDALRLVSQTTDQRVLTSRALDLGSCLAVMILWACI